jgi:two-component sensor histidine kinase/HAMP domain-containing protein
MKLSKLRKNTDRSNLKKIYVVLGSLFFVLPFIVLFYIIYQNDIRFNAFHLIVLALSLVLVLAGLMILRYLFDDLISIARFTKKAAEDGTIVSMDIRKDITELHEISSSFNKLMQTFERTTEDLRQRVFELDTIKELAVIAGKTLNVDDLLHAILDKVTAVVKAQIGSVFAVDFPSGHFRFVGSKGLNGAEKNSYVELNEALVKKVIFEKKAVFLQNIKNDSKTLDPKDPEYRQPALGIPVFVGNNVAAVFILQRKGTEELFNIDDERILSIILSEMSFALESGMLHSKVKAHLKEIEEHNIRLNREIDERKLVEEQAKSSLKEKEILVREIHHRVKNNMQIISSLLNLQSQYVKDKESLEMFRESRNRILSMAFVHEKLYQSEDLAKIDFDGYIRSMTQHLLRTCSIDSSAVKLNVNCSDVLLSIDMAVPCGLIVNELISNSLKHAFPEGEKGEITIDFHPDGDNRLTLVVSDTGIGLPEDIDISGAKTLGLQLIKDLVDQLRGTLEIERDGGTAFRITFTP